MNMEWFVGEGRPSWHQQRVGASYAGITGPFRSREDAEAFKAKILSLRPQAYVGVFGKPKEVHHE